MAKNKKSCFYCVFACIDPGYFGSYDEPGYPAYVDDCKNEKVSADLWAEDVHDEPVEEYMAQRCGQFSPQLIEYCHNCGRQMLVPDYTWELYVSHIMGEIVPVCSVLCQHQMEYRQALQINEDYDTNAFP